VQAAFVTTLERHRRRETAAICKEHLCCSARPCTERDCHLFSADRRVDFGGVPSKISRDPPWDKLAPMVLG
jgi:hypothetical protein